MHAYSSKVAFLSVVNVKLTLNKILNHCSPDLESPIVEEEPYSALNPTHHGPQKATRYESV
jgi:hypothetical protein